MAEVAVGATPTTYSFASVTNSPFTADLETQTAALLKDPAVAAGSFELSLVQVPALAVVAAWVQDKAGSADFLVPLRPSPPALTPGRHYTPADFVAALRGPAQAKLQADAPGKAG